MGRFTFLEDVAVADCAVELEGQDLRDLFETAARALAEVTVDPATLVSPVVRALALSATSPDLLLFDWLSELIFRKDRDREVFPETRVEILGEHPVELVAELRGGAIDPERTALRADPKAVTFHQFVLERREGGWRARVVIDI